MGVDGEGNGTDRGGRDGERETHWPDESPSLTWFRNVSACVSVGTALQQGACVCPSAARSVSKRCAQLWECTKHLIKSFVGFFFFFPPSEFKAGPRFRLRGRSCSCAMEKKKETVFLFGGLFGKTAALPTAASLQRGLKECSPLLSLTSSISPSERLPLVLGSNSPASPRPPPSNRAAAELWSGWHSGSWEMFSQGALNPPAHTSSKQSTSGSFGFQRYLHVCVVSVPLPHGRRPATDLESVSAGGLWLLSSHTSWLYMEGKICLFERLELE